MTAVAEDYERFKALALAVSASALCRPGEPALAAEVARFAGATRTTPGTAAAAALVVVADGDRSARALDVLQAAHRRLRVLAWEQHGCEYVPCGGHPCG